MIVSSAHRTPEHTAECVPATTDWALEVKLKDFKQEMATGAVKKTERLQQGLLADGFSWVYIVYSFRLTSAVFHSNVDDTCR